MVFPDEPPVPGASLTPRVLPVPDLFPLGLVILDPGTELLVFEPASGHHGDEPASPGPEVLHGVGPAQLAVGHVEEVPAARHPAQRVPALLVGAGIVGVTGLRAELHRDPSVLGGG